MHNINLSLITFYIVIECLAVMNIIESCLNSMEICMSKAGLQNLAEWTNARRPQDT